MSKWVIEYHDGSSWQPIQSAKFDYIMEELNGHKEMVFYIPNNAERRNFVSSDQKVRAVYSGVEIFVGILKSAEFQRAQIKCIAYDECYEILKARVIGDPPVEYVKQTASTILSAIASAAGVAYSISSEFAGVEISVKFDRALCYDAVRFLADVLNADFWSDYDGSTPRINIGRRTNSTPYPSIVPVKTPSRMIDRSKKRDKVIIKGRDQEGNEIVAVAGSGSNVAVFVESKVTDQETLDKLAQKKLEELNTDTSGVSIPVSIEQVYNLYAGYYVAVSSETLGLNGDYRIIRITKKASNATVEIERAMPIMAKTMENLRQYESLGIYLLTPENLTVKKISYKGEEPGWVVSSSNLIMQDMADPSQRIPCFFIDQSLYTRKDFFVEGFVGSSSKIKVTFSDSNYVAPTKSSLGKFVYREDTGELAGFLVGYWNSETDYTYLPSEGHPGVKTWWLIGINPIPNGVKLYVDPNAGVGEGYTSAPSTIQPGGGAFQVSFGFTSEATPPVYSVTSSNFPIPSGTTLPSAGAGETGRLFIKSDEGKLYEWYGYPYYTWFDRGKLYPTHFDTLFFKKVDGFTPANIWVGDIYLGSGGTKISNVDGYLVLSAPDREVRIQNKLYAYDWIQAEEDLILGTETTKGRIRYDPTNNRIVFRNADDTDYIELDPNCYSGGSLQDLIPSEDDTYDIGSLENRWRNLYLSQKIFLGSDANLYRSDIDVLKTDDNFVVGNQWLNIDPVSGTPVLNLNVNGVNKGFLAFDGSQISLACANGVPLRISSGGEIYLEGNIPTL